MGSLTYATLFVCGGAYTIDDFDRWVKPFQAVNVTVILAGKCTLPLDKYPLVSVRRIRLPSKTYRASNPRYKFMRAKFAIWKLPHDRVVYYDIDIMVKSPVNKCSDMCASTFCAVRDPIAQNIRGLTRPYFNAGFMVITPSPKVFRELRETVPGDSPFAEQDGLNDYFAGQWARLPKECNWLHYQQNRPDALSDPAVMGIHKP